MHCLWCMNECINAWKKEMEWKCYYKVVVPVVVGLGQALLPNQDNVVVHGTPLYWPLFYLHIYNPNMNRIMHDPIMKFIPFTWPVLKNHHYSSQSQWGYNSPESYCQPPYQHPTSYTPSPEQPLEESIDWEKRMEALDELWAKNSNFRRLKIPSKFSTHKFLLYFSRRTCRLRKEYGLHDSMPK